MRFTCVRCTYVYLILAEPYDAPHRDAIGICDVCNPAKEKSNEG